MAFKGSHDMSTQTVASLKVHLTNKFTSRFRPIY